MKRFFAYSVLLAGFIFTAWPQDLPQNPDVSADAPKNWALSLSYFGETLVHPGLRAGLDYTVAKDDYSALIVGAGLGGYWHPKNVVALFAELQPGYRLSLPGGLFFDLFAGVGYMHVFLDGPVYLPDGRAYAHPGYPEFMMDASLGIGLNIKLSQETLFTLALRLGGFGEYPVNYIIIWHPVVQLAATIPIF